MLRGSSFLICAVKNLIRFSRFSIRREQPDRERVRRQENFVSTIEFKPRHSLCSRRVRKAL